MIAYSEADATIIDDDTSVADPAAPASVCEGASLSGRVGDVFDVKQTGFARWSHVFVDVELSCGQTPGTATQHPTSVKVIYGPSGAIRSRQCITRAGLFGSYTATATSAADGCQTHLAYPPEPAGAGHVLRVPDSAVGQDHQIRAWIDADRDGVHDGGEPYVTLRERLLQPHAHGLGLL